jgi:anti-sigma B factor antagonist
MEVALDIAVRSERGCVIAALTGEIDISTVGGLRERLFELAEGSEPLIVDRVTFIDSAGLGALVGTSRRAAEHGGTLRAVCTQPQTKKLLWMTGVDRRIPLEASLDEALASASGAQEAPGER